jgi:hypothetical protein
MKGTRLQTIAYPLTGSRAGIAAWMVDYHDGGLGFGQQGDFELHLGQGLGNLK